MSHYDDAASELIRFRSSLRFLAEEAEKWTPEERPGRNVQHRICFEEIARFRAKHWPEDTGGA